jgi:hypothetical protein
MEDSSIAFSSRSVLITFNSSESSKEVNPGSTEAFCYASLCCYRERKALYTQLFSFSPRHGQFVRPLNPILVSVPTVRRHGATPPSFSATVLTTLKPHELTLLSSVLSTPDTGWINDRYSPTAVIKREPFTQNRRCEAPSPSELGIITVLDLLPAILGYTAARASFPATLFLPEQAVLPSSPPTLRRSSE